MLYLLLAISLGSLFAILFKIFQRHGIHASVTITCSYLAAIIIGTLLVVVKGQPIHHNLPQYILPALITGGFMAGGFITMSNATQSHGVAIATISARMSFIIPVICAFLFLHSDTPQWNIIAIVALSLILIFYRNNSHDTATAQWYNPVLVFLCYGIANFMLKHLQQSITCMGGTDTDLQATTFLTFAGALIASVTYTLIKSNHIQPRLSWRECAAAIVLGSANMGCTFFLMKALTIIDTSVFYPVYNTSIVAIGVIVGRLFFGEKLSIIQYLGIALGIIAILLFFNVS